MIKINLLPVRAAQKKEKLRNQLSVLFLCLILVGAGCGALYAQQMLANQQMEEEIAAIDAKNQTLRKKLGEIANFDKKSAELEKKLDVLRTLQSDKSGPVRLLDELIESLPKKVWITQFNEKGGNIDLAGFGDREKTVADFMSRLEKSPYYQNVELKVTEQASVGGIKMQKFTLSCRVDTPPVKQD